MRKFKINFLRLTVSPKNPFSNPLQEDCSSFQVASVTLKVVPKAACDSENCSNGENLQYQ